MTSAETVTAALVMMSAAAMTIAATVASAAAMTSVHIFAIAAVAASAGPSIGARHARRGAHLRVAAMARLGKAARSTRLSKAPNNDRSWVTQTR